MKAGNPRFRSGAFRPLCLWAIASPFPVSSWSVLCAARQRASGCPRELYSLYGELGAILGQSRGRRSSRTHPHKGDSDRFHLFNGFITLNFKAPQRPA